MKIIIITCLILISCGESNLELEIEKSNQFRSNKEYAKAITTLKNIEKGNLKSNEIEKVNFLLGEIYLNDIKDYDYSIDEFKKVISNYAGHDVAKKSLFMIAYIYNNYLEAYTDAINSYELFLNTYPNDELAPSVKYELEGLEDVKKSINLLINNN